MGAPNPASEEPSLRQPPAGLPLMIVKVAWLSILLGVGMEVLLLLADALLGKSREAAAIVASTIGKISWSTLACTGLALGARAAGLRPAATGAVGLLCAPAAFVVARVIHSTAASVLGVAGPVGALPLVAALVTIKGLEYGTFGAAVAWIARRSQGGAIAYALVGAALGAAFGLALAAATWLLASPAPPPSGLVVLAANETIFALGCALTLYVSGALAPWLKGS